MKKNKRTTMPANPEMMQNELQKSIDEQNELQKSLDEARPRTQARAEGPKTPEDALSLIIDAWTNLYVIEDAIGNVAFHSVALFDAGEDARETFSEAVEAGAQFLPQSGAYLCSCSPEAAISRIVNSAALWEQLCADDSLLADDAHVVVDDSISAARSVIRKALIEGAVIATHVEA